MKRFAALSLWALFSAGAAGAVSITNLDQQTYQVMVCDENCGPSHGADWGSAFDFNLAAGETRQFSCAGQCYVGVYYDGHSPTLGDMAMDDEAQFKGDDQGYIQQGYAVHTPK